MIDFCCKSRFLSANICSQVARAAGRSSPTARHNLQKMRIFGQEGPRFWITFGRNNYPIGINTAPFMKNHYGDIFHLYVHLSVYSIYIQYCIFTCLNIHFYYSIGI